MWAREPQVTVTDGKIGKNNFSIFIFADASYVQDYVVIWTDIYERTFGTYTNAHENSYFAQIKLMCAIMYRRQRVFVGQMIEDFPWVLGSHDNREDFLGYTIVLVKLNRFKAWFWT